MGLVQARWAQESLARDAELETNKTNKIAKGAGPQTLAYEALQPCAGTRRWIEDTIQYTGDLMY